MDARQWAVQWLGDPWYFATQSLIAVAHPENESGKIDYKSDADLAEEVRARLSAEPMNRQAVASYRTVDFAIEWFDKGPIAFIEAVREVVDVPD